MALSAGYDDAGAYAEFHEMFQGAVKGVWVFVLRMVFKGSGWALRVSTSGGNGEPGLRIQGVEASLPPPYSVSFLAVLPSILLTYCLAGCNNGWDLFRL